MYKEEIKDILHEIIPKTKEFSLDERDNIIFNFQNKNYIIEWNLNYNRKYGSCLELTSNDIKDIHVYRKYREISKIRIKQRTVIDNPKKILSKLRILTRRIREEFDIANTIIKINNEFKPKIIKWIIKEFNVSSVKELEKFRITDNPQWSYYGKNTIERVLNRVSYSVFFKKDGTNYSYTFYGYYPCVWNDVKLKSITINNMSERYNNNKQITNIIRYAKLKNLLNNNV